MSSRAECVDPRSSFACGIASMQLLGGLSLTIAV
jgi:hypothetical protein